MLKKVKRTLSLMLVISLFCAMNVTAISNQSDDSSNSSINQNPTDFSSLMNKKVEFDSDRFSDYQFQTPIEYTVVVQFEGNSLMDDYLQTSTNKSFSEYASGVNNIRKKEIKGVQDDFLAQLDSSNVDYKLNFRYSSVFNGVSITVPANQLDAIAKYDCVANMILNETYLTPKYEVVDNKVSIFKTGIYDSFGIEGDYTGKGVVVGVLDTGTDVTHAAFANMPEDPRMTLADVKDVYSSLAATSINPNVKASDMYVNSKLPYAFDYADDDADVFPANSSHGLHVAGIIAGQDDTYVVNQDEVAEEGAEPETFVGVAPDAQIATFKVFSDYKEGAETDAILAAVSDCTVLGVDIINMSLGSSCGFSTAVDDDGTQAVYDKVKEAGISLIVAASNDGSQYNAGGYGSTGLTTTPSTGTVGSPSTYSASLSVASISGVQSPYMTIGDDIVYYTETTNSSGDAYEFTKEMLAVNPSGTFNYVVVPGYGDSYNYTPDIQEALKQPNTIAVVSRGDISFEDKQKNAAEYGAVGCIIYNNVSGTIAATVGSEKKIPTITISLDAGKIFKDSKKGQIELDPEYQAGPFMSTFSSWGPTEDLLIKPEITGHGGTILSCVVGGYDEFSGTSMASPNIAGMCALLREYVKENFEEAKDSTKETTKIVNQLLMSTGQIGINEYGNPYSPRLQGAGIGDIHTATTTGALLSVDGSDKTKIELGDDPNRTGIYRLNFNVENFSSNSLSYDMSFDVMSETVSSDGITVAQAAYMFTDSNISVVVTNGTYSKGNITVKAGETAKVEATISLSRDAKNYLDANFENGMYVEGFVKLTSTLDKGVNLNIPYLGFYGDWLDQPLFDVDAYEVSESLHDSAVADENKLKAILYESMALGYYWRGSGTGSDPDVNDDMVMPLGEYVFITDLEAKDLPKASMDKIAIGNSDNGIYSFAGAYLGLLRNCNSVDMAVVNSSTGKVVYEKSEENVRKAYSYSSAASTGAGLFLDLCPYELGLKNNEKYTVVFTANLEYLGRTISQEYEMSFYVDYEAPIVASSKVRTTYNAKDERTVFLDLGLYDNNYVQAYSLFCFEDKETSYELTDGLVPVDGGRNTINNLTLDITSYLQNAKTSYYKNSIIIQLYDYALNAGIYEIKLDFSEIDTIDVYGSKDDNLISSDKYQLNMLVGETFDYYLDLKPEGALADDVEYIYDSNIVEIKDGTIYAKSRGYTEVTVQALAADEKTGDVASASFYVLVDNNSGVVETTPIKTIEVPSYSLDGIKYDIKNDFIKVDNGSKLQMYAEANPFYASGYEVVWSVSNDRLATIDSQTGALVCKSPGVVKVNASVKKGYVTLTKVIIVLIGVEFDVDSGYLKDYYGIGGDVIIPGDAGAYYLSAMNDKYEGPFYNNKDITSVVVPKGIKEIGYASFKNCSNLETIYLPSTIEKIHKEAFMGCSSLKNIYWLSEDINWDSKLDAYTSFEYGIDYFFECTALNVPLGISAFEGCSSLETMDMTKMRVLHDRAFAGCSSFETLELNDLRSVGKNVFEGCISLEEVTLTKDVPLGDYMFKGCSNLTTANIESATLGSYAFASCSSLKTVNLSDNLLRIKSFAFGECTALETITLPKSLVQVDEYAFVLSEKLTTVIFADSIGEIEFSFGTFTGCSNLSDFVLDGSSDYYSTYEIEGYTFLYSKDQKTLHFAPAKYDGDYVFKNEANEVVETIGKSAYDSSNANGVDVVIPNGVKYVDDYAFGYSSLVNVILPNDCEYGDYVFYASANLSNVVANDLEDITMGMFANCKALTSVSLNDELKFISDSAFYHCEALTSISIPTSVETIGVQAFGHCYALNAVDFGTDSSVVSLGNESFFGTKKLAQVILPENLQGIGDSVFMYSALTSITIPGTVNSFGSTIFMNASSLASITFEEGITEVPVNMFTQATNQGLQANNTLKTVNLASTITTINAGAFVGVMGLETIDLSNIETIEAQAFASCSNLATVVLTDKTTYIGAQAFIASGIKNIDLSNVEVIEDQAFYKCESLETIDLTNVTYVGAAAFSESAVTSVNMPNVETIEMLAFANCDNLSTATFENVQIIGDQAFLGTKLSGVVIPADVLELGEGVFSGCGELAAIEMDENDNYFVNDGVLYRYITKDTYELISYPMGSDKTEYSILDNTVRIGSYAFFDGGFTADDHVINNLTQVTMPNTLLTIGSYAFFGCGSSVVDGALNCNMTYVFTGLRAPILEGDYAEDSSMLKIYSHFGYYLGYSKSDLVIPTNGVGYDSFVFDTYFEEPTLSAEVKSELTISIIDSINEILSTDASADQKTEIDKVIRFYRTLNAAQKEFIPNYSDLVARSEEVNKLVPTTTPGDENEEDKDDNVVTPKNDNTLLLVVSISLAIVLVAGVSVVVVINLKKKGRE